MSGIRRFQAPSSAQLLRHVLERPELVLAVQELPGEALGRLIERVGLEDAGEIVALATTEQLAQVFDQDLWRASRAGGDEEFQPERFGVWLEVFAEAGDEFLAKRLAALPRDLLQLALHRLVLVLDIDALAVEMSTDGGDDWTEKALEANPHDEWEEFRLIARHADSWDVLWSGLLVLDRDHHELLRDLLERCAAIDAEYIEDNGGLYAVLTSGEMLEGDVAAERADRRAAEGHVAPSDARAFLALARTGQAPKGRDPVTRAYFRELAKPGRPAAPETATPLAELAGLLEEARSSAPQQATSRALPAQGKRPRQKGVVASELAESSAHTLLERALAELGETDPALASTRREELAYLANVWIAGGSHEGRRPRPVEALELVVAVCNDGLERALDNPPSGSTSVGSASARILASTPADLLFRLGYPMRERD